MNLTFTVKLDPSLTRDIGKDIGKFIREVAFNIEAAMKLSMTGPKSGRQYNRPGGRVHIASAPGEAPAVDTGFLINSIQTVINSDTEAEITIGAEYAEALEFTRDRPFVRPAIEGVLARFGRGGLLASARE